VAASADDGDLQVRSPQNGGYPPSGTAGVSTVGETLTVGRRLAFGDFSVLTALLRFDTSSLPDDASVTSATLKLYVTRKADADNRNLVAEFYGASNWPIDAADYSLSSSANALSGIDITTITTSATNSFVLTGLSGISTTGATGFRLHVDGGQPGGDNYVQFASWDDPALSEPQLVVTYTTP